MVKICMLFKGLSFCNNDLNQNSVSFIHMFNACLNCVESFKNLHQVAETRTVIQSVTDGRAYGQG